MTLDDDQRAALGKSKERLTSGVSRQLMSIATGWGKGVVFAELRNHHGFDRKVMVLVHTDELAQGASSKFHQWNPGAMIGTEMGSQRSAPMDTFIVGSVATLGRKGSHRIKNFLPSDFSAVVSDEVHHLPGDSRWQRVLDHFGLSAQGSDILSLGLTATTKRSDGKGLRPWYDEIVFERGILDCIRMGLLCDFKYYRLPTHASLDRVHIEKGKFNDSELSKEINTPDRNGLVVKNWLRYAKDLRTLVFTQNVQHALDLAEAYKALGVSAAAVWGEDPERAEKVQAHRRGELTVLLNAQMLREGYDDPEIMCAVLASPDLSELPYWQKLGRVTRIPEVIRRLHGNLHAARAIGIPISKEFGIVLDMADNCSRHEVMQLPTLLGMPKDLDLRGVPVSVAKAKLDRVAQEFPTANLADLRDLDKLDYIAQQVSLFTVKYPPEVERLTELAWRKRGEGYVLPVMRDTLTLARDLRDEWWVRGFLRGKKVEIHAQNLAGAFNAGDREVLALDERIGTVVKRDMRWHTQAPTEKQMDLCRKMGLSVPAGATRGQVSAALDAKFGRA
jgi:superfamily II DNA or RNA helicase